MLQSRSKLGPRKKKVLLFYPSQKRKKVLFLPKKYVFLYVVRIWYVFGEYTYLVRIWYVFGANTSEYFFDYFFGGFRYFSFLALIQTDRGVARAVARAVAR